MHNCSDASAVSSDNAHRLSRQLRLWREAQIISWQNIWVANGLANGSVVTVTDIIYYSHVECDRYSENIPLYAYLRILKKIQDQ